MKIHIVTVGKPKFDYAKAGWNEYLPRLERRHSVRVTHLADRFADDAKKLLDTTEGSFRVVLEIKGRGFSSEELAAFLRERELAGQEISFTIGGPEGLPADFIRQADLAWSFSRLTFPHDLAMIVLLEAIYRADSINNGQPYHK